MLVDSGEATCSLLFAILTT